MIFDTYLRNAKKIDEMKAINIFKTLINQAFIRVLRV